MMLLAVAAVLTAQTGRSPEVQLKAAQNKEQVEGDLKGAIEAYKRLTQSKDRAVAAKALVALGQCYEKLGNTEARSTYERLLKDFADQPESVALARTRLSALGAPAAKTQTARLLWTTRPSEDPGQSIPSPDGRYLTYIDWATGDLGIRDLSAGTTRLLTNTGGWVTSGDFPGESVFSPDSRQIAYSWWNEKEGLSEIRIVPAAGGASRLIPNGKQPKTHYVVLQGWTPNGKHLLGIHIQDRNSSEIVMISVSDGSTHVIKKVATQAPSSVRLSPDGRFLTYDLVVDAKTGDRDIFVSAADGSGETAISAGPWNESQPQWSPDGSRVVFMSDRTGHFSLWAIPVADGKVSGLAAMVRSDMGKADLIGITRDGTVHYVEHGTSSPNIYTAQLGADGKVVKDPQLITDRFINANNGPGLSPDGSYLAYQSIRHGRSTTLVVKNLKTGEERDVPAQVPVHMVFSHGPMWFPDGKSVLVLSRNVKPAGNDFYQIDVVSGTATLIHRTSDRLQGYRLSPDGKNFYYTEVESTTPTVSRLMRYDLESKQTTELKSKEWFIALAVSPDSKEIAYLVSVRPEMGSYIAVMSASGGPSREIFRASPWGDGSRYNTLGWTADQRHVMFVSGSTGDNVPNVLWRVPAAGGQAEQMGLSLPARIKSPQVDPSGKHLYFSAISNGPNEVWALEHFLK